jgi:hypothetical protein
MVDYLREVYSTRVINLLCVEGREDLLALKAGALLRVPRSSYPTVRSGPSCLVHLL